MSDGNLAFKGLAWGGAAIAFAVAMLPSSTTGLSFDRLTRIKAETLTGYSTTTTCKSRKKCTTATPTPTTSTPTPTPTPTTSTSTPTPTPTPTPTVTPTPTPTGTDFSAGYVQMTTINSNFDINSELVPALMPPVNTDVLGAFRFVCGPGQVRADDPIVYPNQPGASHLHQFFGNTGANASSTYESLRSSGMSTCMSPLNRSAYWMPAMLDGTGNVVRPDFVTIYYKRRPASDPKCSLTSGDPQAEANCIPLPNGLRFVFGYDMLNPSKNDPNNPPFVWECNGPTAQPGTYKNIPEALAHCPAGNQLGFSMQAWHCWDGKNLDSADHRSHMSFVYNTGMGYFRCPADKPFAPPSFIISAWWTILPTDTPSKWMLASDAMHPELPHGSTLHADWFGAWDPQTMAMWNDNCINKRLSCAGGVLGNGLAMKTYADFTWTANPHLVPIP